jgi:hypothetical protein
VRAGATRVGASGVEIGRKDEGEKIRAGVVRVVAEMQPM